MSFPTVGYYAIQPRPEFAEWLRTRTEPDMIALLTEPKLVSHDEFIGETSWRDSENTLRVKILFLAGLRDLTPLADDSGFNAILGTPEISSKLFDRWWTIQYFEEECNVKEFMSELTRSLSSVKQTGNPVVDEWIANLKADSA